jgi:transcription elongation GreA/GreB family factor
MSRAFVNESDAVEELPDRLISDHPNYVTAEGLALIDSAITALRTKLAKAQLESDRNALASVSRDLRYWDARRATAEVIPLPTDFSAVRFGSVVSIERNDGRRLAYRIVGENEADPNKGLLSHVSPLARALMGKEVGDVIRVGRGEAEIVAIGTQTESHD